MARTGEVEKFSAMPMTARRSPAWLWAAFVILPVVIGAVGAFAVASRAQPVYAARSEIIFDVRRLSWDTAERFLTTEVVVAQSRALLSPVADKFRMPVEALERKLTAET